MPALSTTRAQHTRACKHMLRTCLAPHRGHPIAPVPMLVWGAWRECPPMQGARAAGWEVEVRMMMGDWAGWSLPW